MRCEFVDGMGIRESVPCDTFLIGRMDVIAMHPIALTVSLSLQLERFECDIGAINLIDALVGLVPGAASVRTIRGREIRVREDWNDALPE